MYLERLIESYQSRNLPPPRGCSQEEIARAEQLRGLAFPAAYREFLAWAGADSADIFLDVDDAHYLRMIESLDEARAIAAPPHFEETLPDDALIILVADGIFWSFMRASEGDNPPVYAFCRLPSPPAAIFVGPDGRIQQGASIHQGTFDTPTTFIKGPDFVSWLADFVENAEEEG